MDTITKIITSVESHFEIPKGSIKSPSRKQTVVAGRRIAYFLAKANTPFSYPELGDRFNKNHASVLSGVNKVLGSLELIELSKEIKWNEN